MSKSAFSTEASELPNYDLVIIGAGWFGLAAARTCIERHPTMNITLIEASHSCGGTWSEDRIYPGLKSNNLYDAYEFPDYPMAESIYGVKPGQHIPGLVLNKYLTDFAKTFGVYERTQFGIKVNEVEPYDAINGWKLSLERNSHPGKPFTATSSKIIVATGLTSTPNMPTYTGSQNFNAPLFHAKDFYSQRATVDTAKNVLVVGGAKSAYDVAYAYADAGAQVDLVIRPKGNGPIWISHPWVMGGAKRLEKLLHIRWMQWMSPCIFGSESSCGAWVRRFLHGTAVGRWIVDKFWAGLEADVIKINGFDSHPEVSKIRPWNSPFWIGSGLSIHNYDRNFFDMIKQGRVRVHIADIDRLEERCALLTSGKRIEADVMVCSTGWKKDPSIKFVNMGEAGLGLPESPSEQMEMSAAADEQVLAMFPRLKHQPTLNYSPKHTDPYRMYKFIVPPCWIRAQNIAFAGMVSTVSTAICATVQALWICAFLDGSLSRMPASDKAIHEEIMLHSQWNKWRYPTGYGATIPDFAFDAIPYHDLLMNDLGLSARRKSTWLKEITEAYGPADYAGLISEWNRSHDVKSE